MPHDLSASVQYIKGIGPKRSASLLKLGIKTVEDLLYYFPRRYEDRLHCAPISKLVEGSTETVKATVLAKGLRRSMRRKGFTILEVAVGDATGKMYCVWFNQPYLKEYFVPGVSVILYGKVERYAGRLQMTSPEFEVVAPPKDEEDEEGAAVEDESLHVGRIVPIYPVPEGFSQRGLRSIMKRVVDGAAQGIREYLPADAMRRNSLPGLRESLSSLHFPATFQEQEHAFQRLSFDEFLFFQMPLVLRKLSKKEQKGVSHAIDGPVLKQFMARLPFQLTSSQKAVVQELSQDMQRPYPMQRLLQGDVGSGKTVVATIACCISMQSGCQAAFMAPTEILARQHYEKLGRQFEGISVRGKPVTLALLSGGGSLAEKEQVLARIAKGEVDLVIGTHALLEHAVGFKKLSLVVIDEQHKFGVGQRALLPQKGANPDILIMTATPIPRTLAITIYGDLEVSLINEMPPGRLPVKTSHYLPQQAGKVFQEAREHLDAGHQAYVVYPVIEESYALDIAGAKKRFAELKAGALKAYQVGIIHGRMKQEEQDAVMADFKAGKVQALVTTTVLEVGIDIPNATCIIIEHAERFGLAQLHQLRGRVGRGKDQAVCMLISEAQTPQAVARMEAMVRFSDGFRIAEEDLKIRGPGEFFGSRQHGLSELKIANPLTQLQLLKRAREEAIRVLTQDPKLASPEHSLLREKLLERFPEYEKFVVIG